MDLHIKRFHEQKRNRVQRQHFLNKDGNLVDLNSSPRDLPSGKLLQMEYRRFDGNLQQNPWSQRISILWKFTKHSQRPQKYLFWFYFLKRSLLVINILHFLAERLQCFQHDMVKKYGTTYRWWLWQRPMVFTASPTVLEVQEWIF